MYAGGGQDRGSALRRRDNWQLALEVVVLKLLSVELVIDFEKTLLDNDFSIKRSKSMTDSIHDHEIMRKMIKSGRTHTCDTLRLAIGDWFWQTTQFHTCSTENLSADGLIAFLAEQRKFCSNDIGFRVNEGAIYDDA